MIFWTEMLLRLYAGKRKYFECFLSLFFFLKNIVLITDEIAFVLNMSGF